MGHLEPSAKPWAESRAYTVLLKAGSVSGEHSVLGHMRYKGLACSVLVSQPMNCLVLQYVPGPGSGVTVTRSESKARGWRDVVFTTLPQVVPQMPMPAAPAGVLAANKPGALVVNADTAEELEVGMLGVVWWRDEECRIDSNLIVDLLLHACKALLCCWQFGTPTWGLQPIP